MKTRGLLLFAVLALAAPPFFMEIFGSRPAALEPASVERIETAAGTAYVTRYELGKELFVEPFETSVFLFDNLDLLTITTQEPYEINVTPGQLLEIFKRNGKTAANVIANYHNHLTPGGFSVVDKATARYLRRVGFKGLYGIYYPPRGRMIFLEGEE